MIWQKIGKYLVSSKILNYFLSNTYLPQYMEKRRVSDQKQNQYLLCFSLFICCKNYNSGYRMDV